MGEEIRGDVDRERRDGSLPIMSQSSGPRRPNVPLFRRKDMKIKSESVKNQNNIDSISPHV